MTGPPVTLRKAESEQGGIDRIEGLLEVNDLPSGDVRAKPESFFLARAGTTVVGAGGLEVYSTDGLLRSVVIEESHRGRGYGTVLCEELEERARTRGVETLYLLTTTAASFFRDRGYEEVPRETAPPRIRETTQFADLCPTSATCLQKSLDG